MEQTVFGFEDLPLIDEQGFTAAYTDGEALIDYDDDAQWKVASVQIEAGSHAPGRRPIYKKIAAPEWIAKRIEMTLLTDKDWRRFVQERVEEALADPEDRSFKRTYAAQMEV